MTSGAAAVPPDLRLAGLALAAWLAALGALWLDALSGTLVAVAAAVLAGAAAVVRHRRWRTGSARWVTVAVLLGVVLGVGATAARVAVRDASPIADEAEARARVAARVVVRDDPRRIGGTSGRPLYLVPAKLVRLDVEGRRITVPARVLVLGTHKSWASLLPGQRLDVEARLARPRGGDLTAAVLSVTEPPRFVGQPSWAQRAAGSLRAGLQRACAALPGLPGGLLPGLVVGDTSRLDPAVEDDFTSTGMTHLTAVSGANLAILAGVVLLLARWTRARPWLAGVLCGLALVGFVILARPSPSVVRAGAMAAIGLIALALGRPRAAVPALAAAVTVLVVIDPELAGDAGFALSVLATAGLLLVAPRWRDAMRRRGVPTALAEALAIPAAASMACAPVIAMLSASVSLVSIPANLLAAPAVAPATVLGVLATLLSAVWPSGAAFVAWVAHWPAWWLVLVARYGADVPAGSVPWPGGVAGGLLLAALTVLGVIALRRKVLRRLVAVVVAALVVGALPVRMVASGWPPTGWAVVACAVGQGDMLVLPAGAGAAVVVDAGPDPTVADRCLERLRVRTVRLLVVTHFHADHTGGIAGVFRDRAIGAVATPDWPEPAAGRDLVRRTAEARAAPVAAVPAGWRFQAGDVALTVLGPPYPLSGTRSDPNNNSLILMAEVGRVSVLLAGDAETEEQQAMMDRYGAGGLRATVLKVAHHGSAYQDEAFLDAVDPAVALVPVGVDNDYGHPNPAVLSRLARGGARVLRTDTQGDVAVVRRGGGVAVVSGRRRRSPADVGEPADDGGGQAEGHGREPEGEDVGRQATRRRGRGSPGVNGEAGSAGRGSRRRRRGTAPDIEGGPGGATSTPTLEANRAPAGDESRDYGAGSGQAAVERGGPGWPRGVSGRSDALDSSEELVEAWRLNLADELDRRIARAAIRHELAERRRWGLQRRHAVRLARCAETFRARDPPPTGNVGFGAW